MFATVDLSLGEENVATVPADAIVAEGDVRRLFLVRQGRAFELVVRTGITRDQRTAVYEDLERDTPVIRRPPANLRDGSAITTAEATHTAAARTGLVQH
jgi:hypothetical protein